jgi:AraC-like DNA-binding protein
MDQSTQQGAPTRKPPLRFTTRDLPERERVAAVAEILRRGIWNFDLEPCPEARFHVEGHMASFPDLGFSDVLTSKGRTFRTSQHLLVSDQFLLNVCLGGTCRVRQCGREVIISDGDAVLTTGADRATMAFTESRFLSFRVPARAMNALVPGIEDRVAKPIRRDNPALRLLLNYASVLRDAEALAASQLRQLAVAHVHDLVALTLGAAGDGGEMSKARGMRAARLKAIKADIEENAFRDDLSVETLAANHRLPVRYIRRLFEEDGTTFTAFLLDCRLARARALLLNPLRAHHKIGVIAAEAGFCNLSYFNETFRRRFGLTPSDMRVGTRH